MTGNRRRILRRAPSTSITAIVMMRAVLLTRDQAVAVVAELLKRGLTLRDIAELLRAHPRAIEGLI